MTPQRTAEPLIRNWHSESFTVSCKYPRESTVVQPKLGFAVEQTKLDAKTLSLASESDFCQDKLY